MVTLLPALLFALQAADVPRLVRPDVSDLTIKTHRMTESSGSSETDITYFKGARQRRDMVIDTHSPRVSRVRNGPSTVLQCDTRRELLINNDARTYAYVPIEDPAAAVDRFRHAIQNGRAVSRTGPEVTVTIDSKDTGEQRPLGRFSMRHIVTTTIVDPAPGAATQASKRIQDGWYVDGLPAPGCVDRGQFSYGFAQVERPGQPLDRVIVKHLGTAPLGYTIEELDRQTDPQRPGMFRTTRVELLEFSEAPLESTLFEPPAGYRPALPRLTGGFDLSKPDTIWNRLDSYWEGFSSWMNQFLPAR